MENRRAALESELMNPSSSTGMHFLQAFRCMYSSWIHFESLRIQLRENWTQPFPKPALRICARFHIFIRMNKYVKWSEVQQMSYCDAFSRSVHYFFLRLRFSSRRSNIFYSRGDFNPLALFLCDIPWRFFFFLVFLEMEM